jgi:hypothetical protein
LLLDDLGRDEAFENRICPPRLASTAMKRRTVAKSFTAVMALSKVVFPDRLAQLRRALPSSLGTNFNIEFSKAEL